MNKVRIGTVGLGRLGLRHAENIASRIQGAELAALCDVDGHKLEQTADRLGVKHRFTAFADLISCKDIDAVLLVSPSALHAAQIKEVMDAGKHIFSEKPMGVTVTECKEVEKAAEAHPELVFMLGFMRRFDESYKYAHDKVVAGEIGKPVLFRAYSQDPEKFIAGSIVYGPHSGGEFMDMAVHDIDLARWFTGSEPETVYAIGGCYAHPEFSDWKDGDNVSCLMKFKNETMVFLFSGRTAPHGYNVETEIIGTKGILRIASVPQKNLVEVLDEHGVRRECSGNFLERFDTAYINEIQEFVDCIREGRKPEVTVYDGTKVSEIGYTCKAAFEQGIMLRFE
jgi:myo-inositol 2-dehydrogenase/D-chiro-inositol 1-dehydrogenase